MTTGGDHGPTGVGSSGPSDPMRKPTESARPTTGTAVPTEQKGPHTAPTVPSQYTPTAADHPDVLAETAPPATAMRRDGIRWGPIWAGALITLATYLVLQLLFFALGVLNVGLGGGTGAVTTTVVSGVLGLIAFFVGGLVAGVTGLWTGQREGLLQGVTMWALTVAGILAITLIGGGALLGLAADAAARMITTPAPGVDTVAIVGAARNAAGWSALGLGLSVLAAALGGMVGSRMRPQGDRPARPAATR